MTSTVPLKPIQRTTINEITQRIHTLAKRTFQSAIEIGQLLEQARKQMYAPENDPFFALAMQYGNRAKTDMVTTEKVQWSLENRAFLTWAHKEFHWEEETVFAYIGIAETFTDVDWSTAHADMDALLFIGRLHKHIAPATKDTLRTMLNTGTPVTQPVVDALVEADPVRIQERKDQYAFHLRLNEEERREREEIRASREAYEQKQWEVRQKNRPVIPLPEELRPATALTLQTTPLGRAVLALQVAIAEDYGTPLRSRTASALAALQREIQEGQQDE